MAEQVYVPPLSMKVPNPKALRALWLEGGGIRGLSELEILTHIMQALQISISRHRK
ncbi:hypothetical protein BT69DRAFT_1280895 [Atractiella rhizophila]|nr:hypothetical protein BT69DRAFT_1280895 [Atractiella rhizophila]